MISQPIDQHAVSARGEGELEVDDADRQVAAPSRPGLAHQVDQSAGDRCENRHDPDHVDALRGSREQGTHIVGPASDALEHDQNWV